MTLWIIIAASVGGAALIAGAIITAVLLTKHKKNKAAEPGGVALESVHS